MTSRRQFVVGITSAAAAVACRSKQQRDNPAMATDTRPIPRRPLGKTGVNVSILGLGGFHIGKSKDEKESIALVRRAIDSGITFLDNCWDYNDGESELRYGKALRDGYRQRAFLMTKLDGRTQAAATAQLEQSLQRLQTDVIDLVQVHEVIRDTDPGRVFEKGGAIYALIEAKKAGKLRFIGFTGHKDPKIHLAMLRAADEHSFKFDTVQMPLNVFDAHFRSFEKEVLPVLVEQGIGVLGMKSMADGRILKAGVVSPEECLRYALSLPTSVVISGMDKPEILEQNLRVAREFKPLTDDERKSLLARTAKPASDGAYETFKTSQDHDGTVEHPHWLEEARI
ncbi:MAG TPA: aldo/keto reductase [Polyangiaceae bacterium]|nr:aldo/keto reductase [Polyangiaceae bacterium]